MKALPTRLPVSRKLLVQLGAAASFIIVCGALWVLYHTLHAISLNDVKNSFHALSWHSVALAFAITGLSYFVITGYDVLALRHIGKPLPYWRSGLAAFLASAFGNNIGFSLVTGASIRYRIYAQAGLSGLEITGISTFCSLTTALGMMFILALSLLFAESSVNEKAFTLPEELRKVTGSAILLGMSAYLFLARTSPVTLNLRFWSVQLPSASIAIRQLILATLEILLVGSLIYVLLPHYDNQNFMGFLGIFVLALMAGSMSNVPGGIGVFETILILGLPDVPPAALISSIVLFRCIYFLAPLGLAAILFAVYETMSQRTAITHIHGVATDWLAEIGPQIMSIIILFAGVILLFSSTLPASPYHHALLRSNTPLWLAEISHLLASLSGLGLIVIARGIARRLEKAHFAASGLLALGIITSYFKGMDYDEAIALSLILIILYPTQKEFTRTGSLFSQGYSAEWLSTLTIIIAITIWLGLFIYKQEYYTHKLWWTFAYEGDLPRFLRSTLAIFLTTAGATGIALFSSKPKREYADAAEIEKVQNIVKESNTTHGYLVFLGDKRLMFSESGKSFLMYQVQGKSWVVLGDPLGQPVERRQLIWQFRDYCDRNGGWPVFYLIDAEGISDYVDLGLSLIKIGDEARVSLNEFSLLNVKSAELRERHRWVKAQHDLQFEMLRSVDVPAVLPELDEISKRWLAFSGLSEKGFSQGYFEANYISRLPCAIVRSQQRILAFAVLWANRSKSEIALDLMRNDPDAPDGILDFLFLELMMGAKNQNYAWFNLGIAPIKELATHPLAPVWERVAKLIYRQSQYFKNMGNLVRYEDNLKPVWRAKYLASPGGLNLPRVLRDIGRLIVTGPK